MRSKNILYPVILMLLIFLPIARYYASTPNINACVLDYVDNLESSNYKWFIYDIDWERHIEPLNSRAIDSLKQYKIWESQWCIMYSNDLFADMNNTFYCTATYLIKKSPMHNNLKQPLWFLKA